MPHLFIVINDALPIIYGHFSVFDATFDIVTITGINLDEVPQIHAVKRLDQDRASHASVFNHIIIMMPPSPVKIYAGVAFFTIERKLGSPCSLAFPWFSLVN